MVTGRTVVGRGLRPRGPSGRRRGKGRPVRTSEISRPRTDRAYAGFLFRCSQRPHYKRISDEGRTLIQTALASPADLEVTADELRVFLEPLSSPHRTYAIAALCDDLNARPVLFPGSRLRLRYGVALHAAKRTIL